ncbi:MAG: 3-dehydroquinate synthase, partial [Candidatus Hydrogenedentota bacterium]
LPIKLTGVETGPIIEATLLDKKFVRGRNRFVLPLAIGKVVVKDNIPIEPIERALEELGAR